MCPVIEGLPTSRSQEALGPSQDGAQNIRGPYSISGEVYERRQPS